MQKFKILICSIIKILHDLSSNRCEPGWFLSLEKENILVRKDQIFKLNFFLRILIKIKLKIKNI